MDQRSQTPGSMLSTATNSTVGSIVGQFLEEQRWLRGFVLFELALLAFAVVVDTLGAPVEASDGLLLSDVIVGTTVAFGIFIGALGLLLAVGLFVLFVRSGAWKRG